MSSPAHDSQIPRDVANLHSRIDGMHDRLSELVRDAVRDALPDNPLTEDERQWVRLAIQKEAQSIKLRQAIIEKTISGLVWMVVVGFVAFIGDYVRSHIWRP